MTYGGVFWYGIAVAVLSFIAVTGSDDGPLTPVSIVDGLLAAGFNWTLFVLPVLLIRNARRKRRTTGSAPAR